MLLFHLAMSLSNDVNKTLKLLLTLYMQIKYVFEYVSLC